MRHFNMIRNKIHIVEICKIQERGVGMPPEKYKTLKRLLSENGFIQPVILDKKTQYVLDGLNRIAIARELGIKTIPVIYMNSPSRESLRAKIKQLTRAYIKAR